MIRHITEEVQWTLSLQKRESTRSSGKSLSLMYPYSHTVTRMRKSHRRFHPVTADVRPEHDVEDHFPRKPVHGDSRSRGFILMMSIGTCPSFLILCPLHPANAQNSSSIAFFSSSSRSSIQRSAVNTSRLPYLPPPAHACPHWTTEGGTCATDIFFSPQYVLRPPH